MTCLSLPKSRIRRDDEGTLLGYQRNRVEEHIKDICATKNSMLPNSLVVAFDERVSFRPLSQCNDEEMGHLRIPMDFSPSRLDCG